ncbi:MAG: DUF1553 domain-containing protein [Bryobacterales bacterium]|nr:DUF1553 domain-containing protein [Bryobacterales bacterium]
MFPASRYWLTAGLSALALVYGQALKPSKVVFDRQIRPLLSDSCFSCHGPDEKNRMAGLRLDERDGAMKVIVPGKRGESKLFQRIQHADANRRMPPRGSQRTLSAEQIELVGKWIDQGADWQTHWSYAAPKRPELPVVSNPKWARNAIDHFVLARLDKEGLKPSPEADKVTLIRRVSLDLTGLPPTPAEVQSFVSDKSAEAYDRLVARLIESPHYGERMAMQWLDLARYADTHGYHIDSHRDMWPWRDWVIQAFNNNMPYDRFTVEQLAGDLLPNATRAQKLATGFNRNHMINYEGGAIPEEYHAEYIMDRVETTSVVWMGMTMGCARCHDHKYDPITQRDFYRFYAFFHNVDEKGLDGREGNAKPVLPLPDGLQEARLRELDQAIKTREASLPEKETTAAVEAWASSASPSDGPRGAVAHYELDGSLSDLSGGYHHARITNGNPAFSGSPAGQSLGFDGEAEVEWGRFGDFGLKNPFSISLWVRSNNRLAQTLIEKGGIALHLEEAGSIGDLKRGARLRVRFGDGLEVRTQAYVVMSAWNHLTVTYDGAGKAAGVSVYLDGQPAATDALRDQPAGEFGSGAPWKSSKLRSNVDDLRIYPRVVTAAEAFQLAVDAPVRAMAAISATRRTKEQKEKLREYYLTYAAPEAQRKAYAELKQLAKDRGKLEKDIVTAMVMDELPKMRDTYVLARGDYRNRTEKVTAAVPANLPPLPAGAPANRLGLAKWLVDPSHPLTARVAVNRFWQIYFGTGIVDTSEDFGSQGAPPSHPELLDWLATEFIRGGWDVKAMQRLIVTSATYRQSSKATPELVERDPQNKLLARMSRFRLPAELVRDNALATSGLLNKEIGGRSVYPYQPAGLWEEMAYGDVFSAQTYTPSTGKDLYRRSMYTFWKRTVPPAQMSTFDAPDREKCVARRARTNTPLQALVLMNDPIYIEAARKLAEKVIVADKRPAERVRLAFQMASARAPLASEVKLLSTLAEQQRAAFAKLPENAKKLVGVGESKSAVGDAVELAAWTTVASAILNLDEVISKE